MRRTLRCVIGTSTLVIAACLSACGKTDDTADKAKQTDTNLAGTWNLACANKDFAGVTHQSDSYNFSLLGDFDRSVKLFNSDGCTTQLAHIDSSGTTDSLGNSQKVDGAKDINFTVTQMEATVDDAEFAKTLNTIKYCGKEDWQVGAAFDMFGKDCAGEKMDKGEVIFQIYKIHDDQLFLGSPVTALWLDGNDASNRPSHLDENRGLAKQK